MSNISARIVAKSQNAATKDILTTFLLEYPRIIHAELLTHSQHHQSFSPDFSNIPIATERLAQTQQCCCRSKLGCWRKMPLKDFLAWLAQVFS